jgi:hypothetical protein
MKRTEYPGSRPVGFSMFVVIFPPFDLDRVAISFTNNRLKSGIHFAELVSLLDEASFLLSR